MHVSSPPLDARILVTYVFYLSFLAYANDKGMNHGVYIGLGDERECNENH
jgi:hypothetical protein